jgi:hypothetical protein
VRCRRGMGGILRSEKNETQYTVVFYLKRSVFLLTICRSASIFISL